MELMAEEKIEDAVPYSVIAKGYDLIMSHVDYASWASFSDALLWHFHPNPATVMELGCGTGTFATQLQPLGGYEYTASDICPEMVEVAKLKAKNLGIPITFEVEDFSDFTTERQQDVIILLYDGLNYLIDESKLANMFACVYNALTPGGIFFFDQSTPANSINNEEFFRDEGEADGFSYVRGSEYDRASRLHTTTFEIHTDGKTYFEKHVQRAYSLADIKKHVLNAGFTVEHAFDGFSSDPASEESERIHWIVRKPDPAD